MTPGASGSLLLVFGVNLYLRPGWLLGQRRRCDKQVLRIHRTFTRHSARCGMIKDRRNMTKTIRSRFNHEVGENVEGCKILEKSIVAPPDPVERRRGIYDYLVDMDIPPPFAKPPSPKAGPARESYTRSTPDQMGGRLIRRIPS